MANGGLRNSGLDPRKTNKTDLDTKNSDHEGTPEKSQKASIKFGLKKRSTDEKVNFATFGVATGQNNSVMMTSCRISANGNDSALDYKTMSEFYITSQMLSRFKHKRTTIGGQEIIQGSQRQNNANTFRDIMKLKSENITPGRKSPFNKLFQGQATVRETLKRKINNKYLNQKPQKVKTYKAFVSPSHQAACVV